MSTVRQCPCGFHAIRIRTGRDLLRSRPQVRILLGALGLFLAPGCRTRQYALMIVPLAHVAGVPVEETALALAPAWGGAMVLLAVRARSLRERLRGRRRRQS